MSHAPYKLLTPIETEKLLNSMSFDELVELIGRTAPTGGDAEFIVQASEWLHQKGAVTHEHSRRGYKKRGAATATHR